MKIITVKDATVVDPSFEVSGDTFDIKEELKELGLWWNFDQKYWYISHDASDVMKEECIQHRKDIIQQIKQICLSKRIKCMIQRNKPSLSKRTPKKRSSQSIDESMMNANNKYTKGRIIDGKRINTKHDRLIGDEREELEETDKLWLSSRNGRVEILGKAFDHKELLKEELGARWDPYPVKRWYTHQPFDVAKNVLLQYGLLKGHDASDAFFVDGDCDYNPEDEAESSSSSGHSSGTDTSESAEPAAESCANESNDQSKDIKEGKRLKRMYRDMDSDDDDDSDFEPSAKKQKTADTFPFSCPCGKKVYKKKSKWYTDHIAECDKYKSVCSSKHPLRTDIAADDSSYHVESSVSTTCTNESSDEGKRIKRKKKRGKRRKRKKLKRVKRLHRDIDSDDDSDFEPPKKKRKKEQIKKCDSSSDNESSDGVESLESETSVDESSNQNKGKRGKRLKRLYREIDSGDDEFDWEPPKKKRKQKQIKNCHSSDADTSDNETSTNESSSQNKGRKGKKKTVKPRLGIRLKRYRRRVVDSDDSDEDSDYQPPVASKKEA